jgi:hypothetical protein
VSKKPSSRCAITKDIAAKKKNNRTKEKRRVSEGGE